MMPFTGLFISTVDTIRINTSTPIFRSLIRVTKTAMLRLPGAFFKAAAPRQSTDAKMKKCFLKKLVTTRFDVFATALPTFLTLKG